MKKLLSLLLCLTMLFSLVACGGSAGDEPKDQGGEAGKDAGKIATKVDEIYAGPGKAGPAGEIPAHKKDLVIGMAGDINNLNLQDQQDQINNIVLKLTHDTLVFFNNKGGFDPGLAESWEFKDDTHIVFKLKKGVTFSDGSPMTADDVKFTYDMAEKTRAKSYLAGLVETKVIDEHTVELTIDKYNNEFVQSLATVPLAIQSKKAYESGMKDPYYIGTGRYKFVEWKQGEYVKLKKVDKYWGTDPGIADEIIFKPMPEASARVIALQNGEIDVCIDPPSNELQFIEKDPKLTVYEKTGSRLFYFAFNVTAKPWDNKTLRQAVACALDRNAILQVAVQGKGTPQKTILNRGLWGFYDDMPGFPYDLDRAKKLMAEAGYAVEPGKMKIKTKLLISGTKPYTDIATVVQANLAEIGIDVQIEPVEDATLKSTCKEGKQELYLWRWNEDSKVDFVYRDLFYTGSGSNYQHWSSEKSDKLIDLVATEKDQDKRMQDGIELQKYLVEECPQVPLYIANLVIAYNKNLKGTYFYGGGNHNWSHAYIAE